jgi:hypothetical protein
MPSSSVASSQDPVIWNPLANMGRLAGHSGRCLLGMHGPPPADNLGSAGGGR